MVKSLVYTKQDRVAELSRLVKSAEDALELAENFADEHGLDFNFEPAYGMGGYYIGTSHPEAEDYENPGWQPSSMSC